MQPAIKVYKQSWTLGSTHLKNQLSPELQVCLRDHGAKDLLEDLGNCFVLENAAI